MVTVTKCIGCGVALAAVLVVGLCGAVADEGQPPAVPPAVPPAAAAGLALKHQDPLPAGLNLARIHGLIEKYLGTEAAAKAEAEAELLRTGPLTDLEIQRMLKDEKWAASTEPLQALSKSVRADSVANARLISEYAQALATLPGGNGAKDPKDPNVARQRTLAKLFHLCFVDPTLYGPKVRTDTMNGGMFTPFMDLPAAAGLYNEAAAMYERVGKATQDKDQAAQFATEAQKCRDLGAKCAEEGSKIK